MKSLNDALREEFNEILEKEEYKNIIEAKDLDINILKKAFEVLLKNKSDSDAIDKSKTEFENYLINHIKTKRNDH
jgi:hypothetical protein